jgi:glutaconate CoA-transferase subunit A
VTAVAQAARGAWPLGVPLAYGIDDAHLLRYAQMAKTEKGFEEYLREFVWNATAPKSSSPAPLRA